MTAKILNPEQRLAMVYDIERGKAAEILPQPWQTDTCIGGWHYNRDLFIEHRYTGAEKVVPMLVDIVSKNGNLMLSVPLQRGGQPDADEINIVSDIGAWLKVNGEAIYATRPWNIYGEGPSTVAPIEKSEFGSPKDVSSHPFTAEDIRFTQSKDGQALYAFALGWPSDGKITVKSLASAAGDIKAVSLLGHEGKLDWAQTGEALVVTLPAEKPCDYVFALKIIGDHLQPATIAK